MKIAIIGLFIVESENSGRVQEVLHEYSRYIEGRMGIPKVEPGLNIITLVMKAEQDKISAMINKLQKIEGVSAKAYYSDIEIQ